MFSEKHINESMLRRFFLAWKEEVVHSKLVSNASKVHGMMQELSRSQSLVEEHKNDLEATKQDHDEQLASMQQRLDNEQKLRQLMADERDNLIEQVGGDQHVLDQMQREIDQLSADKQQLQGQRDLLQGKLDALPNEQQLLREAAFHLVRFTFNFFNFKC